MVQGDIDLTENLDFYREKKTLEDKVFLDKGWERKAIPWGEDEDIADNDRSWLTYSTTTNSDTYWNYIYDDLSSNITFSNIQLGYDEFNNAYNYSLSYTVDYTDYDIHYGLNNHDDIATYTTLMWYNDNYSRSRYSINVLSGDDGTFKIDGKTKKSRSHFPDMLKHVKAAISKLITKRYIEAKDSAVKMIQKSKSDFIQSAIDRFNLVVSLDHEYLARLGIGYHGFVPETLKWVAKHTVQKYDRCDYYSMVFADYMIHEPFYATREDYRKNMLDRPIPWLRKLSTSDYCDYIKYLDGEGEQDYTDYLTRASWINVHETVHYK